MSSADDVDDGRVRRDRLRPAEQAVGVGARRPLREVVAVELPLRDEVAVVLDRTPVVAHVGVVRVDHGIDRVVPLIPPDRGAVRGKNTEVGTKVVPENPSVCTPPADQNGQRPAWAV
jgi:hypothetical protein